MSEYIPYWRVSYIKARLKRCPFCGKRVRLLEMRLGKDRLYEVKCTNENCIEAVQTGEKVYPHLAILAWNRRSK